MPSPARPPGTVMPRSVGVGVRGEGWDGVRSEGWER